MRRLLVVATSLVLSLAAAEAGIRATGRFQPPPSNPVPRFPELYTPDPELGYTLYPSRRTTYHYPVGSSRTLSLVSNADGFRDGREFDATDSRPRVWMLGDSLVLGDGVEAEDRLTEVIERLEPGWRVDNLGMTGWGLDLMLRAFEKISRRVSPDLVVLAMYTDDFQRLHPYFAAQGYAIPKFVLIDGKLEERAYPAVPLWYQIRSLYAVNELAYRPGRNRYDFHVALLERLRRNRNGVPVAVVFLPGRADTDEDKQRRQFLGNWCRTAAVPFLDLTTVIHAAGAKAFIPNNAHWNELGHTLAGTAIHAFLRDSGLVR
jgi:hypothetical protein